MSLTPAIHTLYTTLYTLYIVATSSHVAMHWASGVCSREFFASSIVDATTSTEIQYSVLHDNVCVHTYYYTMWFPCMYVCTRTLSCSILYIRWGGSINNNWVSKELSSTMSYIHVVCCLTPRMLMWVWLNCRYPGAPLLIAASTSLQHTSWTTSS